MLKRGADIHKKTGLGFNCISVALWNADIEPMIKLLVEKGVEINEKFDGGKTPLHRACEIVYNADPKQVHVLCKYGADPNILDDKGNTPAMCIWDLLYPEVIEEAIFEELALLKFENKYVCRENLKILREEDGPIGIWNDCLEELKIMKDHKFYNGFSLYDVIQMSKYRRKKLILCTKNKNFVAAFESGWERENFKRYGKYLKGIFTDALEIRDILQVDEKEFFSVFKNYLPELITRKLAYFKNEHLFF